MERPVGAGLGPRLAGRLTAELVARSPQYMNCVSEYEIDLRANKVGAIENLGATKNQFDSIDLSDNAIVKMEGFPKLPRLKTLLLNNNRIARIGMGLEESIPNLEWLVLTSNKLSQFADVRPLSTLPKLKYLSLLDNPVTKQSNYRPYVIHCCPKLKQLDFRKVKQQEREQATALFGKMTAAAAEAEAAAQAFEPDEELAKAKKEVRVEPEEREPEMQKGPTPEQIVAIKAAIANASTLDEVQRLERALKSGHMPSEFVMAEANGDGTDGGEGGGEQGGERGNGPEANGGHATAMEEG